MQALASVSFSRFGRSTAIFPENCSTSIGLSGWVNEQERKTGYSTFITRCTAANSGNFDVDLPERNQGPGEFILGEVKKRHEELSSFIQGDGNKDPFWRRKLPAWAVRRLEARELTKKIMELSKQRRLKEIFEVLETAKKVNRKTMNAVLEACVRCDDIDNAMKLFSKMAQPDSCGVDEITYGTLIKGLGKAGMLDAAFEILEAMDRGTAPGNPQLSPFHLNTLINACANAGDVRRARGALIRYQDVIKEDGPSLVTYNMLIKGYARSDNPVEAIKVKGEMELRGIEPNKLTWNSLVLACVRGQDMDMALEVLAEMKEAGKVCKEVAPDVVTYTTLIKGLAEVGDLNGVLKMVKEMREMTSCVMDRVGYTAIIDACITAGSPGEALSFFQEMEELGREDRRMRPRAHAFLSLMRAFSERGDVQTVSSLKSRMVYGSSGHVWAEDRLEADELLIEAAVNSGQVLLGTKILKDIMNLDKQLHISQRGYMAIVRLQTMTSFTDNLLSPTLIKDEFSLDEPLETILPHITTLRPLSSSDKLRNVLMLFYNQDVLPVSDESGKCIGTVHVKDCDASKVDSYLTDVMQDPPATVPSTVTIRTTIETLIRPHVTILAVSTARAVSFLTKDILFNFLSSNTK